MPVSGCRNGCSRRPDQRRASPMNVVKAAEQAVSRSTAAEVADLGAISPAIGVAISHNVPMTTRLQWRPQISIGCSSGNKSPSRCFSGDDFKGRIKSRSTVFHHESLLSLSLTRSLVTCRTEDAAPVM
ncbi:hypothetical protein TIFTF001_030516 [Ficus carica]|uniref:Uncharacterized protein n=1 Tax=Ficus carica TaxID=3494 RepID=A0AA88J3W7_FICCA|nr:hypothetical protein TIFTF001_030516 [Ficus carica]